MKFVGSLAVCLMSLFGSIKTSEPVRLPFACDLGDVSSAVHENTLWEVVNTIPLAQRVLGVLSDAALPKVADSIIGRIVVDVVDFKKAGVFSRVKQPRDTVNSEQFCFPASDFNSDFAVSFVPICPFALVPSRCANETSVPVLSCVQTFEMVVGTFTPRQNPTFWIVVEQFSNKVERWKYVSAIASSESHAVVSRT